MTEAEREHGRLMSEEMDQDLLSYPEAIRTGRVSFADGSALVMVRDTCCPGWWPDTDHHVTKRRTHDLGEFMDRHGLGPEDMAEAPTMPAELGSFYGEYPQHQRKEGNTP